MASFYHLEARNKTVRKVISVILQHALYVRITVLLAIEGYVSSFEIKLFIVWDFPYGAEQ